MKNQQNERNEKPEKDTMELFLYLPKHKTLLEQQIVLLLWYFDLSTQYLHDICGLIITHRKFYGNKL